MSKGKFKQYSLFLWVVVSLGSCGQVAVNPPQKTLKDAFSGKFFIGTALNEVLITGRDSSSIQVINTHFNAVVAENCMKSMFLQPREGVFDFSLADKFIQFGEKHGHFITGHTLVWHSQAPSWFFTDSQGKDVTRDVLIERMRTHITTVVTHFKGKVKGWDVVNEAVMDDGSFRKSKFYDIIGEDFIQLAFEFAHEADPDAELYYNDFSMAEPGKRNGVVNMVKKLQERGVRLDGIGMQCHIGLDYPSVNEFEKSIEAFAALGVKVMITEMDVTVLPMPDFRMGADVSASLNYQKELNPYADALPDSVNQLFEKRYLDFFRLFIKHSSSISRVTLWGVNDKQSWKNDWPVRGRTDYPLLFDRHNQPKPVVESIIREVLKR